MPADQAPVRIRAGAFGHGLPARDLSLSPGHPVLVGADADGQGGALVPVMCLINGTTVARTDAASVVYWHVELDAHDILLAEGLPAESFLDFGCRPFFEGASDFALHNPDFVPPGLSGRCRPVAVEGPLVEAERARIDARFVQTLADDCAWGEAAAHTSFA
ncbi:Hint domain-containing protein [Methylobacterium sp. Leaf123]|uniref:Hint domain-containing protein n=1 Tax=Methylobacterium sp. Leaf123 TaxID=1736264 RepID=UPI000A6E769C|nr:Hint domain-containing protein [Methylobacterium sp. Leaf123]